MLHITIFKEKEWKQSPTFRLAVRSLLMILGVMAGSTAVIMVKASDEHPFLVASYRLLIAAIVLSPLFFRDLKRSQGTYGWRQFGWSAVPALALAVHFISWVVGARLTLAANASLLVNLTPVALPFFLWMFYREGVKKAEIIGTLLALAGALVLSGANLRYSLATFLGDITCFGSMLAYAAYIALGRKNGGRISLWLYMVPLYAVAGVVSLIAALFFINPIKTYTIQNILYIVGLGLIPTVLGHTLMNYSLKYFRGQVVGVANLGQPIFAGVMAFLFFGEVPTTFFFIAAALVVGGVLLVVFQERNGNYKKTK